MRSANTQIVNIRTEYTLEPIGVDSEYPEYSWEVTGAFSQISYRICVRTGSECCWDSGWVSSDRTVAVRHGGKALQEDTQYDLNIDVRTEARTVSGHSFFRTGLFAPEAQQAQWIEADPEIASPPRFSVQFQNDEPIAWATACALTYERNAFDTIFGDWCAPNDQHNNINYVFSSPPETELCLFVHQLGLWRIWLRCITISLRRWNTAG